MRSAWWLVGVLLLSGCLSPGAPDRATGPSESSSSSFPSASSASTSHAATATTNASACAATVAWWKDDAFAAGYASLDEGARANFTLAPAIAAGRAAGEPRWPVDGAIRSIAWAGAGHDGLTVQAMRDDALNVYLSAAADSTPEGRESMARAFLDAVAFGPAGDRGALAQRLARGGGLQHADPAPGGSASYWYATTVEVAPGSGRVSADGLVPAVLENRTDGISPLSDVTFSRALADGEWTLRVVLPTLSLPLPDGWQATFDPLGRAEASGHGNPLPDEPRLKEQVLAALRAGGYPGGSFGDWRAPGC
jgi:hypothetical protein